MTYARRPIGIDLFAGAGGMSLGFEQAGFDVVAAVEIDPIHASVHQFNFPHCKVLAESVIGLSAEKIRKAANIGHRQVDVVFGGAPCQGFSLIGQRALDDPRNQLVKEFVRIVRDLDANYFVFENVKGLTVGAQKKFLLEVIQEFKDSEYDVVESWKVLNAAHYGVPQHRERLFLLGAKKGRRLPIYPERLTYRADDSPIAGLRRGPTCAEALADLPDAERFDELVESDSIFAVFEAEPSAYAKELKCLDNKSWHFGYARNWNPKILTSSMRTNHTSISRRRFAETDEGEVEPVSRFFKLPSKGVSNTLRAGTDAARGAFTSPRPVHYKYSRCVTVREMARLHGYPDWFRFHVTKWHGARQIGNSVPPPLARAVASAVLEAACIKPALPIGPPLCLGDPSFLMRDMAEASKAFGIVAPVGRRDKKSGAKKRKQVDIERSLNQTIIGYGQEIT
jgi:DNA (cytosine-5)-methyltransferase 1